MAADGHGEAGLPVQHALDIGLFHIAAFHHPPAHGLDGLLGADGLAVQDDVLLFQQDGLLPGGLLLCGGSGGGGGTALPGVQQLLHQGVVLRRAHEVLDGDDPGLGSPLGGPAGELVVGDDDLAVAGNLAHGVVDDLNVGDARVLELVADHGGPHGGGAHARVAGKDDLPHVLGADGSAGGSGGDGLALGSGLGGGDLGLGLFQAGVLAEEFQQEHGDEEADHGGDADARDVGEVSAPGGHEHFRDNAAGGGRGRQAAAQGGEGEDAHDVADHGAQDDDGVHEDIGEVNLMDAAHELDDGGGSGGGAGFALARHAVGQQEPKARPGVGLDHEEDGLAHFHGLFRADGGKDAVVDGVVQEEHLGGLHQDGGQGQQAPVHQELYARAQPAGEGHADGGDDVDGQNGQDCADDAHGEVVDHHFKAGGDMALHGLVKLLDAPAAQGAADHGPDEHGALRGGDGAQGGQGAGNRAFLSAHGLAAGVADQDGEQKAEHGSHHAVDGVVGKPAVRDEEGGDQAPGDEGSNVGHDHAAEEPSKFLDSFFHR